MADKIDEFEKALQGKNVPVLVLDNKWHRLFDYMEPDKTIQKMEQELNALLKKQGRLNTQLKDLKKVKKKLMDGIVDLMDKEDSFSVKKREESKRLISECNEKMENCEDELLGLPREIHQLNHDLMIHTMELCYQVLKGNEKEIIEIAGWIDQVRVELKKNIVRKQEKEVANQEMYSYMHDALGANVMELFDMKYNPMDKPVRKKEEK
ncbi:MAG: hypothetical protein ACI4VG_06080 [Lachnospiraceae bacterium]